MLGILDGSEILPPDDALLDAELLSSRNRVVNDAEEEKKKKPTTESRRSPR